MPRRDPSRRRDGFTLIELLVVIAIIGILLAILIPTTNAVRVSAKKAKTRVLFSQLATACEQFKQEYGYYPDIVTADHVLDPLEFFPALTGRSYQGGELAREALQGNKRGLAFYAVSDADQLKDATGQLESGLVDAFGNTEIVVLFDNNWDGLVKGAELVASPIRSGNRALGFGATLVPDPIHFPAAGIRASVLFYSAGQGESPEDIVYSWE